MATGELCSSGGGTATGSESVEADLIETEEDVIVRRRGLSGGSPVGGDAGSDPSRGRGGGEVTAEEVGGRDELWSRR